MIYTNIYGDKIDLTKNGNIVALLMANAINDCYDDPIINNKKSIESLTNEVEKLTYERDALKKELQERNTQDIKYRDQLIFEIKKQIEINRKIQYEYEDKKLKGENTVFVEGSVSGTSYEIGDVLMDTFSFNVARIIDKDEDWYKFDRPGMCSSERLRTLIHKNNIEYYSMRKVDIDLPPYENNQLMEK